MPRTNNAVRIAHAMAQICAGQPDDDVIWAVASTIAHLGETRNETLSKLERRVLIERVNSSNGEEETDHETKAAFGAEGVCGEI